MQLDAAQELHDEDRSALFLDAGVDVRHRAGMAEARHDVDFTPKVLARLGVCQMLRLQNLDDDVAVLIELAREVDVAHPTAVEQPGDLVFAENDLADHAMPFINATP